MKLFLPIVALLTLAVVSKTVKARVDSCFVCSPTSSWEECENNQKKTSCDCSSLAANCDRCLKFEGKKDGVKTYGKMCSTKNFCDSDYVGCQSLVDSKDCEIFCCDEDNCNSAAGSMASVAIITILVLAALVKNIF